MLSRVAANVYWMARYLERAEDSARLINSMTSLLLDLPRDVEVTWYELIKVIGAEEHYLELYDNKTDERSIMRYIISDKRNPGSVLQAINAARENARISRDVIFNDVWEHINAMYHYCNEHARLSLGRRKRVEFLSELIDNCQTMHGIMMGTLTRDAVFEFLRLGRNLERADMTSRIIDVAAGTLLSDEEDYNPAFASIRWVNVLKTLNAYQAFRMQGYQGVRGRDVLEYLLHKQEFPRSIGHCLKTLGECLEQLPDYETPVKRLKQIQKNLDGSHGDSLRKSALHKFVDEFQLDINNLHVAIDDTYFH